MTHLTAAGRQVVVAGAVARGGRLLAARRTRPPQLAGRWELPGGKVEPGEQVEAALVRELQEELGLSVAVVGRVAGPLEGDWPLSDSSVLRVLRAVPDRGQEPRSGVDHDAVRWVAPGEQEELDWIAADRAPVAAALGRLGTVVMFPAGATHGTGTVLRAERLPDGRIAVVVDRTPFHPVDSTWPDQPGDTGRLGRASVLDALTGAIDDDDRLAVGDRIDVRRGDPSRTWVVVHAIDGPAPVPGESVELAVDTERRAALSTGHTACHLAALALNEAVAPLWRKDPNRLDSRGHPDLDQLAIQTSRIEPGGAHDRYRFGRTLRKAGFDHVAFRDRLAQLHASAQSLLDDWVATAAPVRVETGGDPTLAGRRRWVCELPGRPAGIPCGGTHVRSLAELSRVWIRWEPTEDGLDVRTFAIVGSDGAPAASSSR